MQKNNNSNNYKKIGKYLNLPFQMLAIIAFFVFGGIKLDQWLEFNFPVFTLILTIIGVTLSIYVAIKDLIK
ncbi:MAG: AtpZ/AtpI family protein [Bacteroidota bacterium]|nr:AtpZ/AtpI family protein [Bacteroidota bacterium]